MLPSFSSLGWGCVSPVFCWVVLLGLFLLWVELRFSSPFACCCLSFPFGGVVFLLLLWVGLFYPLSSVGWCCLVSSSFGWCCGFSFSFRLGLSSFSSFGWLRSSSLLGGAAFSPVFCWGGAAWSPPSMGGVAFLLSFWWYCLPFVLWVEKRPSSTTQQKTRETHHQKRWGTKLHQKKIKRKRKRRKSDKKRKNKEKTEKNKVKQIQRKGKGKGKGKRKKEKGKRKKDKGKRKNEKGKRTKEKGQRTKDKGQRTKDKGQRTKDKGQRTKDKGQRKKKNFKSSRI